MTLYPTEESNLLVGNERNKKGWNTSVTIFSLGSHFAAGLLGVLAGAYVVRSSMDRSSAILTTQIPLLSHPHSSKKDFTKRVIDKGNWIEGFGISRGVLTISPEGTKTLYASGQSPFDGEQVKGGDMAGQMQVVLKFLDTSLQDADMTACDIVRIAVYTTDIDATLGAWDDVYMPWIADCSVKPASTLIGVASLFSPDVHVEIKVTAISGE